MLRLFLIITIFCSYLNTIYADEPVNFKDENLKKAVESELWISDPTIQDMQALRSLICINCDISDLTGLEHAHNLQSLWVRFCSVSDLSPLAELINLQSLNLSQNQIYDISALSELKKLTTLNLHGNHVSDISPLCDLTNLETLILLKNEVSDISDLAGLTNLQYLDLQENYRITDISPLADLINLQWLGLHYNTISDISALSKLNKISELDLFDNNISDITPLLNLTNLTSLDLGNNPLHPNAYYSNLELILKKNPGISLSYDAQIIAPSNVNASSGTYSDKINISWTQVHNGPQYTSYYRVLRKLNDINDCNYLPLSTWQTSLCFNDQTADVNTVYMYTVQCSPFSDGANASKYSKAAKGWLLSASMPACKTIYVDVKSTKDTLENGTALHPFNKIQKGINAAAQGDTVYVRPGTYIETIVIKNKNIMLTGFDPNEPNQITDYPVIDANYAGTALSLISKKNNSSTVKGFIIERGKSTISGAIYCQHSNLTLANCIITGNRITNWNSAAGSIACIDSNAVFNNCTIADNACNGITAVDSNLVIKNSILWNNVPGEILTMGTSTLKATYSNIAYQFPRLILAPATSNIHKNPLFARSGIWQDLNWISGDYHLLSKGGRWNSYANKWLKDELTSPCINTGNQKPNDPVNMGAYGGTKQASKIWFQN
jgi:Leucine-rich repeat (LRR) protein